VYAILEDRGRQTRVRVGDVIQVDRLPQADAQPGASVSFDSVLLVGDEGNIRVGTPTVPGAVVKAEVLGEQLGKKIVVMRFRRRKNVRVKRGHRQRSTRIRITAIEG
jgi:large subunit ribosomal protein L21